MLPEWQEVISGITDSRFVGHHKIDQKLTTATRAGARIMYDQLYVLLNSTKSQTATSDEIYELIEWAANMMRGMTLDPAIPQHAKGAMWEKIQELEKALEKLLIELEG